MPSGLWTAERSRPERLLFWTICGASQSEVLIVSLKWKVILVLVVVVALAAGYDYYRKTTFDVSVLSISPDPAPADGKSPVTITAQVTRHGEPVEGHNLYAVSLDGGNFEAYRVLTDADGQAQFTYFPFQATAYSPAQEVDIYIRDESNSVFIEIYADTSCVVHLEEPEEQEAPGLTMEDIFA